MTEPRAGYLYRHPTADKEMLRRLLDDCSAGWAWDARTLVPELAQVRANLERCTEGRAFGTRRELRWRRLGAQFDLLLLTLAEEAPPAGFEPLLPAPETPWRIMATRYRWQVAPIPVSGEPDEDHAATAFLAPDGSIQFIALIDSTRGDHHAG